MKKFLGGVKGKQILVSGLAVLVLVAGYYRWSVDQRGGVLPVTSDTLPKTEEKAEDAPTAVQEESDYFAKARYERDCARSEAVDLLKVSAQNEETAENAAASAEKIAIYAKNTENETAIENMVKAKGFSDCVAFVDDSGVRVVVKCDKLEASGVAKIKDIVVQQTGVKATEIKVSAKH